MNSNNTDENNHQSQQQTQEDDNKLSKLLQPLMAKDSSTTTTTAAERVLSLLIKSQVIQSSDVSNAVQSLLKNQEEESKKKKENDKTTTTTTTNEKTKKDKNTPTKTTKPPPPPSPLSSYRKRHIALKFLYNGTSYTGFTENIGSSTDNSIERHLFAALQKTCLIENRDSCNYSRCGRTDKGVSAFGQVVSLSVKSNIPLGAMMEGKEEEEGGGGEEVEVKGGITKKLRHVQEEDLPFNNITTLPCFVPPTKKQQTKKSTPDKKIPLHPKTITELNYPQMLNNLLPPSIRIIGWSPVSDQFSARFSTRQRVYRYYFTRQNLNLRNMKEGLELLVGKHDFRNLCKMDCERVYNFERRIYEVKLVRGNGRIYTGEDEEEKEKEKESVKKEVRSSSTNSDEVSSSNNPKRQLYHIEIIGQAFLWHQIRCIMSILFLIGQNHESPSIITTLLDVTSNPGKPSYDLASDAPLVLHDCQYENVKFGVSVENLWKVHCDLEKQWEEAAILAERTRDGMDCLGEQVLVFYRDLKTFVGKMMEERKKKQRRYDFTHSLPTLELPQDDDDDDDDDDNNNDGNNNNTLKTMTWNEALAFIHKHLSLSPSPTNHKEYLHIPLMKRFKGTTYEEKIASILDEKSSVKRRQRYEENVIKKRKTTEFDKEFYRKKLQEGGSGL